MKLSRSNYELWFIDYTDGKLSPSQMEELLHFLEQHPDLKKEFEVFTAGEIKLEATYCTFKGKASLKRAEQSKLAIEQLIAYMENDLSSEEKVSVTMLVASDKKSSKELTLLKRTRLQPDEAIVFPSKHQLKRDRIISIRSIYRYAAIAASLVFLLAAYTFFSYRSFKERSTAGAYTQPSFITPQKKTFPAQTNKIIPEENAKPIKIESVLKSITNSSFAECKSKQKRNNVFTQELNAAYTGDKLEIKPKQDQLERNEERVENQIQSPFQVQLTQNTGLLAEEKINGNCSPSYPFTKEELMEFQADKKKLEEKPLDVLAKKGLKRIKDAAAITIEEKVDVVEDSRTFALAIGKRFSISRTKPN